MRLTSPSRAMPVSNGGTAVAFRAPYYVNYFIYMPFNPISL